MKRGNVRRHLLIATVLFLCLAHLGASAEAAGVTLKSWTGTARTSNSDPVGTYEYVLFGRYLQDEDPLNSGQYLKQPILWRVLSADQTGSARKALLFSDKNLDVSVFGAGNNYGTSNVRAFLVGANEDGAGGGIFNNANYFSASERGVVSADAFETRDGNGADPITTTNPLFLLSQGQLQQQLFGFLNSNAGDNNRIAQNTAYARDKGAFDSSGIGLYWTRSPSSGHAGSAWDVSLVGNLGVYGVGGSGVAVRPACYLNLESVIFKSGLKDFDSSSPLAAEGGGILNPWILVLGGMAPHDATWPLFVVSADCKPSGAEIDATGKVMTVSWDVALSPAVRRWPASVDFTLTRPGNVKSNPVSVTSDDQNDKVLILTFANATLRGESVTLGYNLNTDAISCDYDAPGSVASVVNSFTLPTANITNNSTATPGGSADGGTKPSTVTMPTNVSATVGGEKIDAEKQTDGKTFLITVPAGTDISKLPINMTLPTGATSVPKLPTSHDFTKGPLEVTITAQDSKTTVTYTIDVKVESPAGPTEKPLFTINVADCEIVVTRNADGTLAVKVRIPFAQSSNPVLLDTVKMIASSLGLANVSYGIVNADGSETPVARMAAKAPYLEIRGTATNMDAIKNGVVTQIQYTLKGDNGLYAQTFANGGLKLADMPGYPSPEPTPSGSSSSGCDAGMAGLWGVALCGAYLWRQWR